MEEAEECDRLIIMADGEVVATGTASEIIGTAQVTVVEAADWSAAFSQLEQAGLPVALAGRTPRDLTSARKKSAAARSGQRRR